MVGVTAAPTVIYFPVEVVGAEAACEDVAPGAIAGGGSAEVGEGGAVIVAVAEDFEAEGAGGVEGWVFASERAVEAATDADTASGKDRLARIRNGGCGGDGFAADGAAGANGIGDVSEEDAATAVSEEAERTIDGAVDAGVCGAAFPSVEAAGAAVAAVVDAAGMGMGMWR